MDIKAIFPIGTALSAYTGEKLRSDLFAGLTVGVMLIPQGMAYAMLAGLPPIYGLYAALLPIFIYGLFGSSRQLAVGPVAMDSLLTAASVGVFAQAGTESYIALALLLAFMAGAVQFTFGLFKLGFIVNFLSHPVISGFTSAAALIIAFSQFKHLFGIPLKSSPYIHKIAIQLFDQVSSTNLFALGIGLGAMLIIYSLKKLHRMIPAQLVAVIIGILAVWLFDLHEFGIAIVGEVPSGLPHFSWHNFDMTAMQNLLPAALTIALISFMESYAISKSVQARHKDYDIDANRELRALGLANITGSLFQAFPISGGFSRTAVNDQAGARTQLASLISAALIALTLLFLTSLFYFLPNAILASVIILAVMGLVDIKEAKYLWKSDRTDFWMMSVSFGATLAFGIVQGIGIGIVLSLLVMIYKSSKPHFAELAEIPGTGIYRNIERFSELKPSDGIVVMRFDAPLYFANADYFKTKVQELVDAKQTKAKRLVLNFDAVNDIDSTALHMLEELWKDLKSQGIEIRFSGIIGPVRDAMQSSGLTERIGAANFFIRVDEAVKNNTKETGGADGFEKYTMQSNGYISMKNKN